MSEPIPESIPTSADPRSKRATKKRALTPVSAQSSAVEALFAHPERDIPLPTGPKTKTLAPPPEIVANVQGSSAGAGSGEFHVYKASRRREYERLRLMEEEVRKEKADREFEERQEEMRRRDEEKTSRNKARREKAKARKVKGKAGGAKGMNVEKGEGGEGVADGTPKVKGVEKGADGDGGVMNGGGEVKNVDEIGIVIHDED